MRSVTASQRACCSHQLCLPVLLPPTHPQLPAATLLLAQLSTPQDQIRLKASPRGIPACLIFEDRDLTAHY